MGHWTTDFFSQVIHAGLSLADDIWFLAGAHSYRLATESRPNLGPSTPPPSSNLHQELLAGVQGPRGGPDPPKSKAKVTNGWGWTPTWYGAELSTADNSELLQL